jgi:hypothetical protein
LAGWSLDAGRGWKVDDGQKAAPPPPPPAAAWSLDAGQGWSVSASPPAAAPRAQSTPAAVPQGPAKPAAPHVSGGIEDLVAQGIGAPRPAPGAPASGKPESVETILTDPLVQAYKTSKGYYDALKGDLTRPLNPKKGLAALPLRALKTGADALGNAFGPAEGAIASIAGRPIEKATRGKVSRDPVGAVGSMAVPFVQEAKAPGTAMKIGEAVDAALPKMMQTKVGRELHALASPATVDQNARSAAALHREVLGKRQLEADQEIYKLAPHAKALAERTPEQRTAFIDYVENRSAGAKLGDSKLQKAADALANLAKRYRARIEYVLGRDGPTFIKDYYAHLWKQSPAEVEAAMARGTRQGSGANLRARKIPTYSEGLAAGLEPRYANPVDAMIAYTENMARFLGTHDIRQGMVKEGTAKWFRPGQQPEGWVPLKGAGVERVPKAEGPRGTKPAVADILGDAPVAGEGMAGRRTEKVKLSRSATKRDRPVDKQVLYGPPGAARIYNNHISRGMAGSPVYQAAHGILNGLVQLKLGLSSFHAAVMGQEGVVSEVAKGFQQAARGKPLTALKTIGAAPAAPIKTALRGRQMGQELLGEKSPTPENAKLNDLWVRAGGRLRMDKIYGTRGAGSFFNAWERGTLKGELKDAARNLYTGPALKRAQAHVDLVGNVIQSTAAPLFEKYIPAMKRGAWASRMSDWLAANPNASEAEIATKGRDFLDNIDNRFGEVIVDNNFWNRAAFQIGQLLLLSPSWNIGTVREIGGGVLNVPKSVRMIAKGKGVDDKTAYVAALAATTMLQNGVMTKVKTGQNPEGMDWFAYRTGGKNPDGTDERAMIPGYMKDVMAFTMNDPRQEVVNKLNPGLKATAELWANKDYRGLPIQPEKGVATAPGDKGLGSYLAEQASPISVGNVLEGRKAGSNVGPLEALAAIRPAPSYLQDPARHDTLRQRSGQREWQRKRKADARAEARLEKNQ